MADQVRDEQGAAAGWYRRMSLRGRLALLTAVAVSLAVVLCATASWFFARDQMLTQVDQTLQQSVGPTSNNTLRHLAGLCTENPTYDTGPAVPTVVFGSGRACPPNDPKAVVITPGDVRIAGGRTSGPDAQSAFRSGRTKTGQSVQVYVVSMPVRLTDGTTLPMALLVSQPFAPVQDALDHLALLLTGLAVLVTGGSALGALWVAHTALRPVGRLTEAVEEIARTQEPGTTIAVSGTDEIARLGESFNAMSTALASSRDRQSQLIADAGHELRTPLTSLRTNVDLLVRSEETGRALPAETRSRMLRTMKAQMVELSTLIGDLLELSRPARARGSRPPQIVPLHDLVARALDRARLRGPELVFRSELEPWYARVDVHAMERAVINLLDNAVKFSPPGGAVEVRLRSGTLTVRDQGPGIPAEDLPHVFERFWRSPAARQLPGSGLGLAMVAQTVRDAGGEVSLADGGTGGGTGGALDGGTGGALATLRLPGAPTPPPPLEPPSLAGRQE
ncbi:two-component system sensor histidine kinase MprB [Kitasatospora sp. MAP12-15]|uniref:sensor histidine kinase n=1 Tax=unclassified Kitasatospora TaxID=2633591 RepID=UPI002473D3E5|nr:HAMP domain-containing sensor histidine kinase [Kitasatospora sp. MAP12-44]MDH6113939.1 two-component system sensor histidine kinase MprB [Kitasatospora sp. MAP12-44]